MSLLQIQRLKAPVEIKLDSAAAKTTEPSVMVSNTDTGEIFTCVFNRKIIREDLPKTIYCNIYDERGALLVNKLPLSFELKDLKDEDGGEKNSVKFTLTLSPSWSGSSYIHAFISDSEISFKENYLGNFHESIKHVHLYAKENIEKVYWSSQYNILKINDSNAEENKIDKIDDLNKNVHVHIKMKGLHDKIVKLYIYTAGNSTHVATIEAAIYRNRKVVTMSAKYLVSIYGTELKENTDINITFTVKAVYEYIDKADGKSKTIEKERATLQITGKLTTVEKKEVNGMVYFRVDDGEVGIAGQNRYKDFQIGYICHIEGIGKLANFHNNDNSDKPYYTVYPFHTYIIKLSDLVKCGLITVEDAKKVSDTYKVDKSKFNKNEAPVSNGKLIDIFLDKTSYKRDKKLLSVAHKENIRKVLNQVDKTEVFKNKELLFICRDAWQVPTEYIEQDEDTVFYEKTVTKTMTTIAKDGDDFSKTVTTEITKYEGAKRKEGEGKTEKTSETEKIAGDTTNKEDKTSTIITVTKIHQIPNERRTQLRYNYGQECPFGDYFLNYICGDKYCAKISRQAINQDILVYDANIENGLPESPNREIRNGIALHRGTAIYSTGCLTFNVNYEKGRHVGFEKEVFDNQQFLNFICIDERDATREANAS